MQAAQNTPEGTCSLQAENPCIRLIVTENSHALVFKCKNVLLKNSEHKNT
jgi:hypothetical protein